MNETNKIEFCGHARRRGGMTLVEIMIAMVILSFGLLGVAALQVRAITEGSGGEHLSSASAIARNRVEALVRQGWAAPLLANSGGWTAPVAVVTPGQTYAQSERIATNLALTIKTVEVRVQWNDNKRQGRQVVLSSARLREVGE